MAQSILVEPLNEMQVGYAWNNGRIVGEMEKEAQRQQQDIKTPPQAEMSATAREQDAAAMEFFALDSRDRLQEVVKRATIKLQNGFSCFPDGDALTEYVKLVAPQENCFDVAMHGNPTAVGFGTKTPNMSPRTLASVIRHSEGYHGQDIRLLSCSTGQSINGAYCFAEELANALGVKVLAPNMKLYITKSGVMWIGKHDEGEFVTYTPNQRRRFK